MLNSFGKFFNEELGKKSEISEGATKEANLELKKDLKIRSEIKRKRASKEKRKTRVKREREKIKLRNQDRK